MPPRKASVWPLRGGLDEAAHAAVALMPLCGREGSGWGERAEGPAAGWGHSRGGGAVGRDPHFLRAIRTKIGLEMALTMPGVRGPPWGRRGLPWCYAPTSWEWGRGYLGCCETQREERWWVLTRRAGRASGFLRWTKSLSRCCEVTRLRSGGSQVQRPEAAVVPKAGRDHPCSRPSWPLADTQSREGGSLPPEPTGAPGQVPASCGSKGTAPEGSPASLRHGAQGLPGTFIRAFHTRNRSLSEACLWLPKPPLWEPARPWLRAPGRSDRWVQTLRLSKCVGGRRGWWPFRSPQSPE